MLSNHQTVSPKKTSAGFTIIELLVTLGLLAILAGIILFAVSNARTRADIGAGKEFSATLYHSLGANAAAIWDFDEGKGLTVADKSGNKNTATLYSASQWSTDVPTENGYSFNDSYQYGDGDASMAAPNSASLSMTGPHTIAAWVKKTAISRAYGVGYVVGKTQSPSLVPNYALIVNDSGQVCYGNKSLPWNTSCSPSNKVKMNTWTHIAATYSGAGTAWTIRLYVNGKEIYKTTSTVNPASVVNTGPVSVTTMRGNDWFHFVGKVDDVRIYAQTMTTASIQKLYAEGAQKLALAGEF
jgi:prepilin-type N-terminal cleavage/methylation domain-containing protein